MEKSQSQRHKHGGSSPYLLRSKSGSTAAISSPLPKTSITSKSEARKIKKEAAVAVAAAYSGNFVKFLPRSASKAAEVPKRKRSASTSPSAWALSPGRSLPSLSPATAPPVVKPPAGSEKSMKREMRSGVSGVLKYFRMKRVSPLLEEEYHQFRLSYNRLLQWRFANARAEASMAAVRRAAQVILSRLINENSPLLTD